MIVLAASAALLLFLLWLSRSLERDRSKILIFMLANDGRPVYGLEIVDAGASARGMVYVVLHELEDAGLVRSWNEPDVSGVRRGLPRRMYELTGQGRAVANDEKKGRF